MSAAGARQTKGNRSFITILGLVLLAGIGAIGYRVSRSKPVASVVLNDSTPLPKAQGYAIGSDSAPVEIVEFADFECPSCAQFAIVTEPDIMKRLVATGLARFRFVDTPNPSTHPSALFAHNAAACANVQGKFWEMRDRIFAGQHEWSAAANGRDMNAPKILRGYAATAGVEMGAFNACFDARQFERQIMANQAEAIRVGVQRTPSILVGKRLVASPPYDVIKALVDSATAEAKARAPAEKAGT